MAVQYPYTEKSLRVSAGMLPARLRAKYGGDWKVSSVATTRQSLGAGSKERYVIAKLVPVDPKVSLGAELMVATNTHPERVPHHGAFFTVHGFLNGERVSNELRVEGTPNPSEIHRWVDNLLL